VQALDQLHDALLRLGERQLPSGVLRGSGDEVQVLLPVRSWEDYLDLSLDEIRIYGGGSLQVSRRLRWLLEDLRDRLPAARHPAVAAQLRLLDRAVEAGFSDEADRRRAGLGSSPTSA
jgi:uncharacterized membrane protein